MSRRQERLTKKKQCADLQKSRPLRSLCASTQTPHKPRVHESSSPVAHSTERPVRLSLRDDIMLCSSNVCVNRASVHSTGRPVALSLRDEVMLCSSGVCVNRASAHSTERPVAVSSESLRDLTLYHKPHDEVNKLLKKKTKVIRTVCEHRQFPVNQALLHVGNSAPEQEKRPSTNALSRTWRWTTSRPSSTRCRRSLQKFSAPR